MSEPTQEPSSTGNAGDALVALAAAHHVDVIFGLVSVHNQPLVEAAAHDSRFVAMRHEAGCVNAADAYARVNESLGIAITSTGTGAGNAAGSLVEALTAGSPVLHVTGQIDDEYLGAGRGVIHETKDQAAMLRAVSKTTTTVRSGDDVAALLESAADQALTPPQGPASVEIPIDVQYRPTSLPGGAKRPSASAAPAPPPSEADIAAAVALLQQSQRPALWLGGGAIAARAAISSLAELLGAAVFTSNAGRGTIDERDGQMIGNFAASVDGAALLADADLLISIGTHFRSNETRHYKLALPRPHIQIDVDPAAIGRVHPADVGIVGDAASAVTAMLDQLDQLDQLAAAADWATRIAAARVATRTRLRDEIGPYATLCDAMRTTIHDRSPVVRDVTIAASAWGNRLLEIFEPATNVNPRGGGIGQGLAMAIGASMARPDVPTLLMVGDGGLAVHLGELGTVAQERPWLVIVVFNDGGYGVLRNLQDHHFGRRSGVDLTTPDFAKLCGAYDIEHRMIAEPEDCMPVLAEAVSLQCPVVVELDCESFGPMPKPFVPPVPVQKA